MTCGKNYETVSNNDISVSNLILTIRELCNNNICFLHDSALTQIRWDGKWVHLT